MSKMFHRKSNGIRNRYKCSRCKRGYTMDWALKNHEKHCIGEQNEK